MVVQFFSKLSQNYIELLKDDEYYDITIEVGEDPNVKIFRAHKNILCYRSPYLRRVLSSNKKNNDNILSHIKLQSTSPKIFQIILEYIYGGILSLDEKDTSDFLKLLATADKLNLQELVDYLQGYLIENKSERLEQYFEFAQQISSNSNNLLRLQEFCTNLMVQSPEKVLKSLNFTSLSEKSLISLIKNDDLQMKEIEIWEYVLKWGLAKNPTLIPDPKTWSDDDFETMKNTLQHCLPFVRFFCLSPKEFSQKVRPYQKLLNQQLYEDLLNFYLDPDSVTSHNIQLPRKIKIDENIEEVICSLIVNSGIISTISRWIDKIVINDNNFNESYLPYKFELLLRGSRDGFTPKKFHELCDNKPNTVTFIKIKGTEEIIGGYNPVIWESPKMASWGKSNDSFIFSFKNKNNFKDAILSNLENKEYPFWFSSTAGPYFGNDFVICALNESADYNVTRCSKRFYEKKIRNSEDNFTIEDYEVFHLIKK
ncbi:uncharacterized protein OCT59_025297 [Rhizophagus irregularis]|uniref:Kelch-like protein 17 n=1 Tax=Rhizophagus irregularis (strain DAOM 197198w) TaxID=1432141 RepID=A0A015KSX5_RHIIW|nr:hypothetical protein RirG_084780 [Rhizophagus irregularis DAOM 197198w]UZO04935.1 hypothetical protein OCT59_025297 [Rhizophagus irregularis]